jgi:DNA-binding response OmpR family regulator
MFVIQNSECTFHNATVYLLHEVRVIVFGERQIRFTPIEYTIMQHLLMERPVSDKELIADIFHSDVDMWTRDALDKHIGNLRRKLKKTCVHLSILRVATFGYILVMQEERNNKR